MERIIAPVDFSPTSYQALLAASRLAKKLSAPLHVIHVIRIPVLGEEATDTSSVLDVQLQWVDLAKKKLQEWVDAPEFEGVDIVTEVSLGDPALVISREAEKINAELIVMGTKGTGMWEGVLLGSVAERLVRTSEIPVLTISELPEDWSVNKIIFASNFYGESVPAFKRIRPLLQALEAEVKLLKVVTPGFFETTKVSRKMMADFQEKVGWTGNSCHQINARSVEEGILEFAEQEEADLLVLATHGRSGISHFIYGSKTEEVIHETSKPVLSVRFEDLPAQDGVLFPK